MGAQILLALFLRPPLVRLTLAPGPEPLGLCACFEVLLRSLVGSEQMSALSRIVRPLTFSSICAGPLGAIHMESGTACCDGGMSWPPSSPRTCHCCVSMAVLNTTLNDAEMPCRPTIGSAVLRLPLPSPTCSSACTSQWCVQSASCARAACHHEIVRACFASCHLRPSTLAFAQDKHRFYWGYAIVMCVCFSPNEMLQSAACTVVAPKANRMDVSTDMLLTCYVLCAALQSSCWVWSRN